MPVTRYTFSYQAAALRCSCEVCAGSRLSIRPWPIVPTKLPVAHRDDVRPLLSKRRQRSPEFNERSGCRVLTLPRAFPCFLSQLGTFPYALQKAFDAEIAVERFPVEADAAQFDLLALDGGCAQ